MVILGLSMKRLQITFRKSAQEFLIVESTTSIYNLISKIDSKQKNITVFASTKYKLHLVATSKAEWEMRHRGRYGRKP